MMISTMNLPNQPCYSPEKIVFMSLLDLLLKLSSTILGFKVVKPVLKENFVYQKKWA